MVATVPTGLQTCAKLLQMHLSGGGGTPWLKPKSNVTFESAPTQLLMIFFVDFGFKYCHYSGNCAHRLQTCAKVLQMHLSGGGGTPWLKPKSNVTFKLASAQLLKIFTAYFGFKYFHYGGNCAHRVANLC